MSTCFSCGNPIKPGAEQCHYCGQEFHHTHFVVFKKEKTAVNTSVSFWRRFFAGVIDILYLSVPILVGIFFLDQPFLATSPWTFIQQTWFIISIFVIFQIFLLVHDGQTVGKKCMKIAIVVHNTREHPSPFQVVVLRSVVPFIPFALPAIGIALYGINLAWMLGGEQRCLHDFIAGTEVVHE